MELDDLKARWNADVRDVIRINTRAARALHRSESSLRRHGFFVALELFIDAILLLALGSFLADHIREPRFFIPALLLHVWAIAMAGAEIRQLVHLHRVEYGGPVVAIQKQLERMRVESIRMTKWILITAPLLWLPLLIVAMKALLGVDAWAIFETKWIVANFLLGVAFLGLMLWVSNRFGERMRRSTFVKRWMDDLAGRSLQNATRFIDEVDRFEQSE